MDPVLNPYQPGAGRRPPELAGRDDFLSDVRTAMRRMTHGTGDRGRVLHGLRGVGKTVLLTEFYATALRHQWIAAMIEASPERDPVRDIARTLHRSLRDVQGRPSAEPLLRRAIAAFKAFTLRVDPGGAYSFSVEVDPARGIADTGDFATDLGDLLEELGRAANDLGVGVMLLIDEMQALPEPTITGLNQAVHRLGQGYAPLPVMVIGAGLPSLPGTLAAVTTYAERLFEYRPVGALSAQGAADALLLPSANLGVEWEPEAARTALDAAMGYPFAVQECGRFVWDYATANPISLADAREGVARARAEMDSGIYLSRWTRATPAQREVMRVIAEYGENAAVPVGEVATTLGKRTQGVSMARNELIKKGLVYSPDRGLLAFTIPGMADYVRRLPET